MRFTARVALFAATAVLVGCGAAGPAPAASTSTSTSTSTPTSPPTTVAPLTRGPGPTVAASEPRVVVLDPGHNGGNGANPAAIGREVPDGRGGTKACNTTGTETDAGYPEHAFTWDVSRRVQAGLEDAGVRVVLTRPDDDGVGPCVDERGRAGEAADADAVVSIHADGSAPADSGFHVALSDPPLNAAQGAPARELAVAVRDAMRTAGFPDSDYIGDQALSPRGDLGGLNLATRPTVLVECANMRNPGEAALVSSEAGRQRYAEAIAAGILAFLG
ncbi:N-acetylmuramoyl-L-alanine amidase [Pseudonocardia petroleophila]|uniref:N-acetylmuramoyl-L-alanine amidase n=1 Tax=Pseudonocardia petroleophila TaxID=37331 RepID=A0A7G7MEM1_9PSEU|nr:N-acetylmuramoyl-L-alanine amidase [Pseudonocardia petroleophila]QNG51232.1 N-acetylmuramoyl-L-alanine amidase [Pseudonocardia petroleophila]